MIVRRSRPAAAVKYSLSGPNVNGVCAAPVRKARRRRGAASASRSKAARRPVAVWRCLARASGGNGLADLRGRERARRQSGIAEADFDLDDAVPPHSRADGERQLEESELEMRDLQALRRDGDLAIGGETRPAEPPTEGLSCISSGNNEHRSLNSEHADLFNELAHISPSEQIPDGV